MAANVDELFQIKNRILGVLINEARQSAGQSLQDCAELLGITADEFAAFESGRSAPSLPQLEILAYAFNLPIKHFWGTKTLSTERKKDDFKERVPELTLLRQKIIGLHLHQGRDAAGLTLAQVAEKTTIDETRLDALEKGATSVTVSELELICRSLKMSLDDLIDNRGPIGNWLQAQEDFEKFSQLPAEMREFVLRPINRSYIELAMRLSDMKVEQLRGIAEGILEITY